MNEIAAPTESALVSCGDDTLTVTGVRVHAYHGVFEQERRVGQPFIIDVTLWLAVADAANSDDLAQTVHYGELSQQIYDAVANEPVDLIETLAERVARVCLAYRRVHKAQVTVHKPEAPIEVPFDDVSVTITRKRR